MTALKTGQLVRESVRTRSGDEAHTLAHIRHIRQLKLATRLARLFSRVLDVGSRMKCCPEG